MTDWDAIVARESDAVWRTLWKMLGRRSEVEDCFQDTFVSALRVVQREEVVNWTALLCRLATTRAIDTLRKRYRTESVAGGDEEMSDVVSPDHGPLDTAVAQELSSRLRTSIGSLAKQQAEVFSLFAIHGWSQRDIAESLGMTENSVSVTVHRARCELKKRLKGDSAL